MDMIRKVSEDMSGILKIQHNQFSKFQTKVRRTYPFAKNIE
jgi:hypothetical protein